MLLMRFPGWVPCYRSYCNPGIYASTDGLPPHIRLCYSGQDFACTFLQTIPHDTALGVRLGVPVITASRGTCTLQVTSRFAFACRLTAPVIGAARHARRTSQKGKAFASPFLNSSSIYFIRTSLRSLVEFPFVTLTM